MTDPHVPQVVIVGAGFAGLNAARRLDRQAGDRPLDITIVDRHNFHTFQPLLYQVATAGLQPQDIGHSVRGIFRRGRRLGRGSRVAFRLGTVVGVDLEARRLRFSEGDDLAFDHLVLAVGASTNDYGIPGVAEHAFGLKSIPDATNLRNHVLERFEVAEAVSGLGEGELTFVVAGGGPTGVELAGALAELVDHVLVRDHPALERTDVRIVLVEMLDTVLPPYAERLRRYTAESLRERGVELRLGTAIDEVTDHEVVLADGERIPTRTLVWTAGVKANPLAEVLGLELTDGGRIAVDDRLRVPRHPGVWVAGDLAGAEGPDGELYPQLAPVAIQQGKHVAGAILARLEGRDPTPFRYLDKGTMATIGRRDAVVELPFGLRFGGTLAWISWLFLHLMYLVGFRNRVAVLFSWAWNYVTWNPSARLILDQDEPDEQTALRAG